MILAMGLEGVFNIHQPSEAIWMLLRNRRRLWCRPIEAVASWKLAQTAVTLYSVETICLCETSWERKHTGCRLLVRPLPTSQYVARLKILSCERGKSTEDTTSFRSKAFGSFFVYCKENSCRLKISRLWEERLQVWNISSLSTYLAPCTYPYHGIPFLQALQVP